MTRPSRRSDFSDSRTSATVVRTVSAMWFFILSPSPTKFFIRLPRSADPETVLDGASLGGGAATSCENCRWTTWAGGAGGDAVRAPNLLASARPALATTVSSSPPCSKARKWIALSTAFTPSAAASTIAARARTSLPESSGATDASSELGVGACDGCASLSSPDSDCTSCSGCWSSSFTGGGGNGDCTADRGAGLAVATRVDPRLTEPRLGVFAAASRCSSASWRYVCSFSPISSICCAKFELAVSNKASNLLTLSRAAARSLSETGLGAAATGLSTTS
mmetsp:Transcript_55120/g.126622  ORF Transcript_55120/g.126622 Transcript_55120/m.126622 type:complete len:279 (-) Transcript_55120:429-1265(-)